MKVHEAIQGALKTSKMIMIAYLSDLQDEELLIRLFPSSNHIAWQLGHLIVSEYKIMENIKPGFCTPLTDEFIANHSKDAASVDDKAKFETKEHYIELYKQQRDATIDILNSFTAEELSNPGPEFLKRVADTIGGAIQFLALHELTHCGQFVPLRRKLGKPVLI
jgi:uncharacterized damage-inducible protein DinB